VRLFLDPSVVLSNEKVAGESGARVRLIAFATSAASAVYVASASKFLEPRHKHVISGRLRQESRTCRQIISWM